MSVANQKAEKLYQKHAWLILFIVGILLGLGGLLIAAFPDADVSTDFETSTSVNWDQFSTMEPEVAQYILRLTRLTGIGFAGFAFFGVAITWKTYRLGHRWAWGLMWLFPIFLGLTAIAFFNADASGIGRFYTVATVIGTLGLLLPYRKFFPSGLSEPEAA